MTWALLPKDISDGTKFMNNMTISVDYSWLEWRKLIDNKNIIKPDSQIHLVDQIVMWLDITFLVSCIITKLQPSIPIIEYSLTFKQ